MMVLTAAFDQWCKRPADQRFGSIADLKAAVNKAREMSVGAEGVRLKTMKLDVGVDQGKAVPVLTSPSGQRSTFTNFAFGQLAAQVKAPAAYLRTLPAELVVENINHGIDRLDDDKLSNFMFSQQDDDSLRLRAATSERYSRIWNSDVVESLERLTLNNPEWQPAPAAFDGSRGLYAGDEDMFAFLVNNDRRIFETAPGGGLSRGFFVSNSEVGKASFSLLTFWYEFICGNHRVWGVKKVEGINIRHVGTANERWDDELGSALKRIAEGSTIQDEADVRSMRARIVGNDRNDVIDALVKGDVDVNKKLAEQSYDLAVQREDWYGNPRSVWGITGAMTEIARDLPNADQRTKLEATAGKIMRKIQF